MHASLASSAVLVASAPRSFANSQGLVITYRSAEEKARALVAEIESGGGKCLALRADLGSQEAVASVFKEILERCGRIDVLVNTEGYIHQLSLFQEKAPEDTQRTLDVELMSVINACRAVIPQMIQQSSGCIVTVGSDSGKWARLPKQSPPPAAAVSSLSRNRSPANSPYTASPSTSSAWDRSRQACWRRCGAPPT